MIGTFFKILEDGMRYVYTYASAVTANTPLYVSGLGYLIPTATFAAADTKGFYRSGVYKAVVANGVTTVVGMPLYYDETNGVVTHTKPTTGSLIGTALTVATGNSTGTIFCEVDLNVFGEEGLINVYSSAGLFKSAYASIDLALAAVVANDTVVIKSGSYTLAASVSITKPGVKIIGVGLVEINGGASADNCFSVVLGALSSTAELWFKNIIFNHEDDATQIGIQINNTAATKKINVYLNDCEFNTGGGNSVDVDHADTSNAIRVYANRCFFEGPFNAVTADNGDRFRFTDCRLLGGLVTDAGNFDTEILLLNCVVLHQGVTGGHSNQRLISLNSFSETDADPNVYAAFDTNDAAGSHAEQIVGGS